MHILDSFDKKTLRDDIPEFAPGDTVKVHVNIIEGKTARVQVFQGYVMGRQGYGVRETFRVRKVSFGIGVERVFPVHSPVIDKIEVVTKGDVRRAKLYYMRRRDDRRVNAVANIVKQYRASEMQQAERAKKQQKPQAKKKK